MTSAFPVRPPSCPVAVAAHGAPQPDRPPATTSPGHTIHCLTTRGHWIKLTTPPHPRHRPLPLLRSVPKAAMKNVTTTRPRTVPTLGPASLQSRRRHSCVLTALCGQAGPRRGLPGHRSGPHTPPSAAGDRQAPGTPLVGLGLSSRLRSGTTARPPWATPRNLRRPPRSEHSVSR